MDTFPCPPASQYSEKMLDSCRASSSLSDRKSVDDLLRFGDQSIDSWQRSRSIECPSVLHHIRLANGRTVFRDQLIKIFSIQFPATFVLPLTSELIVESCCSPCLPDAE